MIGKIFATVHTDISEDKIRNLLVSAWSGGSNYWMSLTDLKYPKGTTKKDFLSGGQYAVLDEALSGKQYWQLPYVLPFVKGGGVVINDFEDEKKYILTLDNIKTGLQLMADKSPHLFAEIVNGDDDCNTADVFLQFCLLGEITYG